MRSVPSKPSVGRGLTGCSSGHITDPAMGASAGVEPAMSMRRVVFSFLLGATNGILMSNTDSRDNGAHITPMDGPRLVETPSLPLPDEWPPHALVHAHAGHRGRVWWRPCPGAWTTPHGHERAALSCHYRAVFLPTVQPSMQERRARGSRPRRGALRAWSGGSAREPKGTAARPIHLFGNGDSCVDQPRHGGVLARGIVTGL
jgi:hypothetical protein